MTTSRQYSSSASQNKLSLNHLIAETRLRRLQREEHRQVHSMSSLPFKFPRLLSPEDTRFKSGRMNLCSQSPTCRSQRPGGRYSSFGHGFTFLRCLFILLARAMARYRDISRLIVRNGARSSLSRKLPRGKATKALMAPLVERHQWFGARGITT